MVGFDAHFVMLALRPAIPASVDHAKDRVLNLLDELQTKALARATWTNFKSQLGSRLRRMESEQRWKSPPRLRAQ